MSGPGVRVDNRPMPPIPVLVIGALALALASCGGRPATPAAAIAAQPPAVGAFAVRIVDDLELRDEARGRTLTLRVWYPEPPGRYPVIVFSPELGRSHRAYEYLGQAWAARGYVSIHVSHPGSDIRIFSGKAFWRFRSIAKEVATEPRIWRDRAADVGAIIDRLAEVEGADPALAGRLDPTRIGVAGHSLGALTALLVAGLPVEGRVVPGTEDRRPLAFVVFSPPGPGAPLPDGPWDLKRPLLLVTGGRDEQPADLGTAHPPSWRAEPYATLPPGGKAHLAIAEAHHFTFSNGGASSPPVDPDHLAIVQVATCAFWDRHLKGVPGLEATLSAERLAAHPGVEASTR